METKCLFELELEAYLNQRNQLINTAKAIMREALQKREMVLFCDNERPLFISYDGGNNPDYASCLYSRVFSMFMIDGEIFFDIQDCDEYSIDRLRVSELVSVVEYLIEHKYV